MRSFFFTFLLLLMVSAAASAQRRDSITLKTATGAIYGTLTLPKNIKCAVPVVIIIAGSGPTDRDGNSGMLKNYSIRTLSDSLAKYGVASLRYDKRGIGASKQAAPDESVLRFSDYVSDAEGWTKMLARDKRFNKVFVAGHSEGSLIGMVAVKHAPASGYISIAGAGKPADAIVMEQLRGNPKFTQTLLDSSALMFEQLKKTGHIESVPSGFYQMIFRPSVQPYLASWLKYDPAKEIAGVKIPTLLIQGTKDIQVDTMQAHLLSAAKPDAQLVMITGMNHILKHIDEGMSMAENMITYHEVAPIEQQLVQSMLHFINDVKTAN